MLSERADLPDADAMLAQVRLPSRTVTTGTAARVHNPDYLLRRWRSKVSATEETELMRIPQAFGIDVYEAGRFVPAGPFVHGSLPIA